MSDIINNRIPRLRFPGFVGEWEEKKLGEVTYWDKYFQGVPKELQPKVIKYPYVLANVFSEIERKNGDVLLLSTGNYVGWTTEELAGENLCEGEVVAIPWGGVANVKYAKGKFVTADNRIATSSDVRILNNKFLYYLLLSEKSVLDGFYRGASIKHPSMYDVLNMLISIPSLAEQQRIADCLTEIDNLVVAQGQKVDALQERKQGLMQQLFPRDGETTPRLRFPGLEGEWIEKKLGDILIERKEISVITDELPQLSFTIAEGVIKPEDRKTNQRDFLMKDKDNKRFAVTRLNDIIYNPANVVFGAIHKNNLCDGVVSPIYKIFWTKENADFISYLLRRPGFISLLASRTEGTVTKLKTLKADAFLDITVLFPTESSEQQKIASCLSSLDDTIQSETDKLEALKAHKKGLMQQLFPQHSK